MGSEIRGKGGGNICLETKEQGPLEESFRLGKAHVPGALIAQGSEEEKLRNNTPGESFVVTLRRNELPDQGETGSKGGGKKPSA